jgi:2,3-diphosphopglycerate-independent phosphoglycerate mutase
LFVPSFEEKHGLRPFIIAPTAIIRGVGITFQIPILEVEGATGYYDSNLEGKALRAAEAFKSGKYDYGFVHVKATDDAGHDRDHNIKVEQLEKCDKMIRTFIDAYGGDDVIICVTGDHTTPTYIGDHTNEPVPVLVSSLKNF